MTDLAQPQPTVRRRMLLRTKIALIVTSAILLVAIVLVAFAEVREAWVEERYDEAVLTGDQTALTTLFEIDERSLSRANWDIRDRPSTRALLDLPNEDQVTAFSTEVQNLLRFQEPRPDVILLNRRFQPVASVGVLDLGDASGILSPAFDGTRRNTSGLMRLDETALAFVFVHEIRIRDRVAGYLVTGFNYGDRLGILASGATSISFVARGEAPVPIAGRPPQPVFDQMGCCAVLPEAVRMSSGGFHAVGTVSPLDDILGRPLGDIYILRDISEERSRQILLSQLSFLGIVMVASLAIGVLVWLLRTSFRPLTAVVEVLRNLSVGNTDVGLTDVRTSREIDTLAETVESFRRAQRDRLKLVSLNEQIASAGRIQMSILPHAFDIDPALDIHATMRPAQDVGGDFYDVFRTVSGRPAFVVADVAGKGIPSSLFAATASATIRAYAQVSDDPAEILTRVNQELCRRNEEGLFLTVFLGVYDRGTGTLAYANAGHPPPFVVGSASARDLPPESGDLVLGALEDIDYERHSYRLAIGETLIVYSDGLNEAMTPDGTILGEDAARDMAMHAEGTTAEERVTAIMTAVVDYSGERGLADDVTLVAFSRNPEAETSIGDDAPIADDLLAPRSDALPMTGLLSRSDAPRSETPEKTPAEPAE
ncbi:MAG: PP2C family protein-serine/threonine phosphatase [Pseudomonadota bacterium]